MAKSPVLLLLALSLPVAGQTATRTPTGAQSGPTQPASNSGQVIHSTGVAPDTLKPETSVADLQAQLHDANATIQQLQDKLDTVTREKDKLSATVNAEEQPTSAFAAFLNKYSWVSLALPLFATFLSCVALAWSVFNRHRSRAEFEAQQKSWRTLDAQINKLQSQSSPAQPSPARRAPNSQPPSPTSRRDPEPEPETAKNRQPEIGIMRPASVPVMADDSSALVAPAPDPAPTPQTQLRLPVIWQKTNNLADDYNCARTLGLDAEDAFQAAYRCASLSCANLNDLRKDPQATLRFEQSNRGLFLAVAEGSRTGDSLIVPAFGKDFTAARASFEGVFTYEDSLPGGLLSPAKAVLTNGLWTLTQAGEIGLG